jgi:predicted RNA-binding protein Jag
MQREDGGLVIKLMDQPPEQAVHNGLQGFRLSGEAKHIEILTADAAAISARSRSAFTVHAGEKANKTMLKQQLSVLFQQAAKQVQEQEFRFLTSVLCRGPS